ncbi:MAG: TetR/AcrR family transcriptional regulator [Terriglobales bacterium]
MTTNSDPGPPAPAAPRRAPAGTAADDQTARGRILAAASKLFAEGGFDRTPTARIAAEARVPHGLIFYHFRTKMDLLLAVVRDDQVTALDSLIPPLAAGTELHQAVAEIWRCLQKCGGITAGPAADHSHTETRSVRHFVGCPLILRDLEQELEPQRTPSTQRKTRIKTKATCAGRQIQNQNFLCDLCVLCD